VLLRGCRPPPRPASSILYKKSMRGPDTVETLDPIGTIRKRGSSERKTLSREAGWVRDTAERLNWDLSSERASPDGGRSPAHLSELGPI